MSSPLEPNTPLPSDPAAPNDAREVPATEETPEAGPAVVARADLEAMLSRDGAVEQLLGRTTQSGRLSQQVDYLRNQLRNDLGAIQRAWLAPSENSDSLTEYHGMGVVLGPVSGLFVIDVDGPEAHAVLIDRLGSEPRAPKSLSGSRQPHRYHLFFRCPDLPTKAKATPWHPKLEFRGKGGVIILPPSLHKSGHRYEWAKDRSPDDLDLPDLPAPVVEALRSRSARPQFDFQLPATGVEVSESTARFLAGEYANGPDWNKRLFQAACDLAGRGLTLDTAEPLLLAGAKPWDDMEKEAALRTIHSAYGQPRSPGLH